MRCCVVECCYSRQPTSHIRPPSGHHCLTACTASTTLHCTTSVLPSLISSVEWLLCHSFVKPLLLAALLLSLLSYIALFSSDKPPPPPLSPDPLTAAGQWLVGSLLAVLLTGGQRALATVCLAFLLCVVHALLRSVSFTSRTHARAAMVARRTPLVQLMKRMEQDGEKEARRASQLVGRG